MDAICKVDRYLDLSEGEDILSVIDVDEVEFYTSACDCEECMGQVPQELVEDPDFAELSSVA